MKNFFSFIRRFFNLILFFVLEIICCVLISRTNTIQGNDLVNSSNSVTGFIYQKQNELTYYFRLREMNDSLIGENTRLHNQIAQKYYSTDIVGDSIGVSKIPPADSTKKITYAHYTYRSARVINNSVARDNNYLTLNRGSADGIREGMSVISGSGVVGKIVHTSAHFATALSVLSEIQQISVKLKDGTTGVSKWAYEKRPKKSDIMYMDDVSRDVPLHIGDTVFTTSYSFFPPDVVVGIVKDVLITKKTNKRLLILQPGTNFRNVQYVFVAENTMNEEQKALEAVTEKDQKKNTAR